MDVLPVDLAEIVAIFMGILCIMIPVAGITARFALKPIVEAIARAREMQGGSREAAILEKRVALLEQQIHSIEGSLDRLAEDSEFRRQLEAPHA